MRCLLSIRLFFSFLFFSFLFFPFLCVFVHAVRCLYHFFAVLLQYLPIPCVCVLACPEIFFSFPFLFVLPFLFFSFLFFSSLRQTPRAKVGSLTSTPWNNTASSPASRQLNWPPCSQVRMKKEKKNRKEKKEKKRKDNYSYHRVAIRLCCHVRKCMNRKRKRN